MTYCDYLIVGGGIAAYSAGKKIQRLQPDAKVVLVSHDQLPPYDLPPLSKEFLRGVKSEAELVYGSIASDTLEIVTSTAVEDLDAEARQATLSDGRSIGFSGAILATGADPIRLPVPGAELENVFYLRTAADSRRIAGRAQPGQRAVVVGGGFIGIEIAASLRTMGCEVVVIEALDRIWPRFGDATIAEFFQQECQGQGIRFLTSETVVAIQGDTAVRAVATASGEAVPCDFVVVGIGIRPNVELARRAGLEVDNGIVVDAGMRTSKASIFAAGDVVNYLDPVSSRRMRGEHWGHAEYSGQLAGENATGGDARYDFMNYAWSDVFDLHVESAGHIEGYDEVIFRGRVEDRSFTALYLKENALLAYCAVNCPPKDFASFRRLIRSRQDLSSRMDQLGDPEIRAKALVDA